MNNHQFDPGRILIAYLEVETVNRHPVRYWYRDTIDGCLMDATPGQLPNGQRVQVIGKTNRDAYGVTTDYENGLYTISYEDLDKEYLTYKYSRMELRPIFS